jgi:outer membrane immunogenic protein
MRGLISICTAAAVLGCASAASAADLPVRAPRAPVVVATAYNWSGIYIGGHVGGAWGNKDWVAVGVGPLGSHDVDGFIGGGQLGFNYQTGALVFGAEVDFSWAGLDGSFIDNIFLGNNKTEVKWLGTVTGRIGYAWDRMLLYVKGGGAWVRDVYTITGAGGFFAETKDTNWGWTIGAGLEYGLTPNWSVKAEYNYLDFGTERIGFTPNVGAPFQRDVDQNIHVVKVGINYRFGAGPVVARY